MQKKNNILFVILSLILLLCTSVLLYACSEGDSDYVGGTGTDQTQIRLTLNRSEAEIGLGKSITLIPTVEGTDDYAVVWTSSDESVAEVAEGVVTGVSEGTTEITAKISSEAQAKCTVTVTSDIMPIVEIDRTSVDLVVGGEDITAKATVRYDGMIVAAEVEWASADPGVATVENGVISPVAAGETEVTASLTYNGKYAEQTVLVNVHHDVTITVSQQNLDLYSYALSQDTPVSATITAAIEVGGKPYEGTVTVKKEGSAIDVSNNGNEINVKAVAVGEAEITLSYQYDEVSATETVINVSVTRPVLDISDEFIANVKDENASFDFSGYDWKDKIIGVYVGDTLISEESNPSIISQTWLVEQKVDSSADMIVALQDYDVKMNLLIKNEYATMNFYLPEAGSGGSSYLPYEGDLTAIGYSADDQVYTYDFSGSSWTDRMSMNNPFEYDYVIFDISLSKELTAFMNFWIPSPHVISYLPNGLADLAESGGYPGSDDQHKRENCFQVYDENGNQILSALQPNTKYTIEISLMHAYPGNFGLFEFSGGDNVMQFYIANTFACSSEYYSEYIAPQRTPLDTQYWFNVDKGLANTQTLDFDAEWEKDIEGLYFNGAKISEDGNATKLSAEWLAEVADDTLCIITVKVKDGSEKTAIVEITNLIRSVDVGYWTPSESSAAVTVFEGDKTVIGFKDEDTVYSYVTNGTGSWVNRIETDKLPTDYDWWIFDWSYGGEVNSETDIIFWIGGQHVIGMKGSECTYFEGGPNFYGWSNDKDKHNQETCLKIYDANGNLITGDSFEPNTKYTIEICLNHVGAQAMYQLSISNPFSSYIGNSYFCTDEYYELYVQPTH